MFTPSAAPACLADNAKLSANSPEVSPSDCCINANLLAAFTLTPRAFV